MKAQVVYIFLFSIVASSFGQNLLDTAKLAVFNQNGLTLTPAQIKTADSILINTVNYYNAHAAREYELVCLSDSEYSAFSLIDSLRKIYLPYITESGKIKKNKFSKLNADDKNYISKLIEKRSYYDSIFLKTIKERNQNCNDPVVLNWGSIGRIEIANYCRQYTYSVYKDGSIFIRASVFCSDMVKNGLVNWKKNLITIHDGGNCFFTVNLDLKSRTGSMMKVNGF
ncbi:MAG: hypothetical protein IAF38_11420 [Bacteroidia bacterium]|nr:hypothetical protein [Bacteroidia bacterium]